MIVEGMVRLALEGRGGTTAISASKFSFGSGPVIDVVKYISMYELY